ncbi:uncharacterized protein LALA0_S02e01486g [Lachancea lanzarotensis]|uniref:LALA0S02e01486g1_1 n=1 Tax=Lachancea lanzarotensis TaxID=1245769 RepID=A0A0C7MZ43_9SACH|nr:uncharacterized protein LALA0_S02e01486g [Lachancea lanzarotensis]CEP60869.1 LALA0S02e01486g1_1 [Lachancea lanzarotensis]
MKNQKLSDTPERLDSPASIQTPLGFEPEYVENLQNETRRKSDGSPGSKACDSSADARTRNTRSAPQIRGVNRTRSSSRLRSQRHGHGSVRSASASRSYFNMQTLQDRFPYTHFLQDISVPSALSLSKYMSDDSHALPTITSQWPSHPPLLQNSYSVADDWQTIPNNCNVADARCRQLNPDSRPSASHLPPQNLNLQSRYEMNDIHHHVPHQNISQMHSNRLLNDEQNRPTMSPANQSLASAGMVRESSSDFVRHPESGSTNIVNTGTFLQQPAYDTSIWPRHHSAPQSLEMKPSIEANPASKRQCPLCHKIFSSFTAVQAHALVHSGDKPYLCPYPDCAKSFNVKSNMVRHYKLHAKKSETVSTPEPTSKSPT